MKSRLVLMLLVPLLLIMPGTGHAEKNVKKAKQYMQVGMYPDAIALLEEAISEDPTDADAHFQLGICYFNTHQVEKADQRFDAAISLKDRYSDKISDWFRQGARLKLEEDLPEQAATLFEKAIQYKPDLQEEIAEYSLEKGIDYLEKDENEKAMALFNVAVTQNPEYGKKVAKKCLKKAKTQVGQGKLQKAAPLLALAKQYDETLGEEICQALMDTGDAAADADCSGYYSFAAAYCPKDHPRSKKAGDRLVAIARKMEASDAMDSRIKENRDVAANYVDVRPTTKIYGLGSHYFALSAGEQTEWIDFPKGAPYSWLLYATNKSYKILLDDGTVIDVSNGDTVPPVKQSGIKLKVMSTKELTKFRLVVRRLNQ